MRVALASEITTECAFARDVVDASRQLVTSAALTDKKWICVPKWTGGYFDREHLPVLVRGIRAATRDKHLIGVSLEGRRSVLLDVSVEDFRAFEDDSETSASYFALVPPELSFLLHVTPDDYMALAGERKTVQGMLGVSEDVARRAFEEAACGYQMEAHLMQIAAYYRQASDQGS